MSRLAICMANGCEEIEGLTVVDVLRRAKIEIDTIAVADQEYVTGSHGIPFCADRIIGEVNWAEYDGIILPGGMPGTIHLGENQAVCDALKFFATDHRLVAAICAAPSVLGACGILEGKKATSYPGFAEKMPGCTYLEEPVVCDDNIITSRGMGTAIAFALAIVEYFTDYETAVALGDTFLYDYRR